MPAKVKVRILAGRNLPVMDKSSDASDAFVEVKLGAITYKTEVFRRSLNPFWNSEWFRFEVCDQELQDEPLQIRVMDYDTYSANDAIGKVYINLNPLLINTGRSMNGWLPIYDTLHGIRGEINVVVKVSLFADHNRFRHSSCGVRFFYSDVPNGYRLDAILGFVDELLVNDDPEYQWIDKIRTPRASNEARQTLFTKLSGEVQRKLGLKAEVFGGNAVVGYQQSLNLEGSTGIVGRGIGTAVRLSRLHKIDNDLMDELNTSSSFISSIGSHLNRPFYASSDLLERKPGLSMSPHHQQAYMTNSSTGSSNRQLVHSASADYFYEVPSKFTRQKRLISSATTTERSIANKTISSSSQAENDSDDETFVSLNSSSDDDKNNHELDSERFQKSSTQTSACKSTQDFSTACLMSPTLKLNAAKESIRRLADISKSFTFAHANDLLTPASKASRLLSLKTLKQTNENLYQKLAGFASRHYHQPVAAHSETYYSNANLQTKLTKLLLPHRQRQAKQSPPETVATTTTKEPVEQPEGIQSEQASSTNQIADKQKTQIQLSTSTSISSSGSIDPTTNGERSVGSQLIISGGLKRRSDKSQTTSSIDDDVLSTIEEKFDDETPATKSALAIEQGRVRLLSGGSDTSSTSTALKQPTFNRHKPFTRSKEIDLSASEADCDINCQSNAGVESSLVRSSTNAGEESFPDKESDYVSTDEQGQVTSPTILSDDSIAISVPVSPGGSSVVLTDETIKHLSPTTTSEDKQAAAVSLASSVDNTVASKSGMHLRRSDTDLAHMQITKKLTNNNSADEIKQTSLLSRSESQRSAQRNQAVSPSELRASNQHQKDLGASFAQSVGVVKAQQHLLQNLVRHQNQNLIANTLNKAARNSAFAYPGRIHLSEYPFSTIKKYPEGWIRCTGGVVTVHSVKLLDQITSDEESETRDCWWLELRREIRAHAKALNCNTILGYSEISRVLDDICILSARGTAAVVRPPDDQCPISTGLAPDYPATNKFFRDRSNSASRHLQRTSQQALKVPRLSTSPPLHATMPTSSRPNVESDQHQAQQNTTASSSKSNARIEEDSRNKSSSSANSTQSNPIDCSFCHTPLHCVDSLSVLADCAVCCQSKVPHVLLLTIEPPKSMNIVSSSSLIQARVCRSKRDTHGEAGAKEIGDAMPFLEYELHRQLLSKLKFKGLNCVFNLTIEITVGENLITGVATGTACFVLGLPAPEPPVISAGKGIRASKLTEIQRLISLSAERNREALGLKLLDEQLLEYHRQLGYKIDDDPMIGDESGHVLLEDEAIEMINEDRSSAKVQLSGQTKELAPSDDKQSQPSAVISDSNQSAARSMRSQQKSLKYHQSKHNKYHSHYHHHHRHHRHGGHKKSFTEGPAENLINLLGDENNIVLEVDDNEDADIISLLIDSDVPNGYIVYNSDSIPSVCQHQMTMVNMFTQVTRIKVHGSDQFAQQFDQIMQTMYVKLRRALPCCLSNLHFAVQLPESHVIQVTVTGCVVGLKPTELKALGIKTMPEEQQQQAAQQEQMTSGGNISSTSMSPASSVSSSSSSTSTASSSSSSSSPSSGNSSYSAEATAKATTSSSDKLERSGIQANTPSSTDDSTKDASIKIKLLQQERCKLEAQLALEKEASKKQSLAKQLSSILSIKGRLGAGASRKKKDEMKKSKSVEGTVMEMRSTSALEPARSPIAAELAMHRRKSGSIVKTTTSSVETKDIADVTPTTRATIEAVKQEIMQARLGPTAIAAVASSSPTSGDHQSMRATLDADKRVSSAQRSLRTVFKKQQTYPGANSPAISGQDNVLQAIVQASTSGATGAPQTSSSNETAIAARRATANLINKVKQPLRELGSNFNISPTSAAVVAQTGAANPSAAGQTFLASEQTKTSAGQQAKNIIRQSSEPKPSSLKQTAAKDQKEKKLIRSTGGTKSQTKFSKLTSTVSQQQQASSIETSQSVHPASEQSPTQRAEGPSPQAQVVQTSMLSKLVHHRTNIDITSLSFIPNAKEYQYLGALSFSFIRETNSVRENGGLNGFVHCFLMEVYAIVRAHVAALGGNAFTSFRLQKSSIFYHSNKNQAQCLISITGDACLVSS